MLFVKIAFVLLLSLFLVALSEVLWHKFLFHNARGKLNRKLALLWNYDVGRHTKHHFICEILMEDPMHSVEEYWVQKPSNVFAWGCVSLILEVFLLWMLGFSFFFFVIAALSMMALYTFWYQFEDHFHVAMHKKAYYESYIKNTWQDKWFKYCKRLHIIHHRNEKVNLGFIFFPIGDLILGTYRHTYEHMLIKNKNKY